MSVQVTADPYELRDLAPLPEYESHVAELDKILLSEVDYPGKERDYGAAEDSPDACFGGLGMPSISA